MNSHYFEDELSTVNSFVEIQEQVNDYVFEFYLLVVFVVIDSLEIYSEPIYL